MTSKERIVRISKSLSLDSLSIQPTANVSILTSTRDQEKKFTIFNDNKRRKAILPTPNKPKREQNLITTYSKKNSNGQEQQATSDNYYSQCQNLKAVDHSMPENDNDLVVKTVDSSIYIDSNNKVQASVVNYTNRMNKKFNVDFVVNKKKDDNTYNTNSKSCYYLKGSSNESDTESQSPLDEDMNDSSFDTFILQNFIPFSGHQDVIQWLDETENKFNRFHIARNLRFGAVSLLVEGDAKRKYIKARKDIHSFDDFYEFLLSHFESPTNASFQSKLCQTDVSNMCDLSSSYPTKSIIKSEQVVSKNSDTLNSSHFPSKVSSTAMDTFGVADVIGDKPVVTSTASLETTSTLICDQTLNDLRKAIADNLIKNPKTFKGGHDDVKKWIEEVEHLLDLAHIPESTRLDLISYSLRGDALEWFKNNRSALTSWDVLVRELKKAFTSSFHEELAFKKLELYSQGQNQSVRTFFNEVLKLCKEADPHMSESTKLKNLLNKTTPSIQFDVRKKKPTSIGEFLEYAKEAEELMQLSNLTIDTSISHYNMTVAQQQPASSSASTPSASSSQPFDNASNTYSMRYSRDIDHNNQFPRNRNTYSNSKSSSFSLSDAPQNTARFNNNSSRHYRYGYSNNSTNRNTKKFQPSKNNSSNNTYSRQRTLNTVDSGSPSANTDPLSVISSSSICNLCNKSGHEASPCPSF